MYKCLLRTIQYTRRHAYAQKVLWERIVMCSVMLPHELNVKHFNSNLKGCQAFGKNRRCKDNRFEMWQGCCTNLISQMKGDKKTTFLKKTGLVLFYHSSSDWLNLCGWIKSSHFRMYSNLPSSPPHLLDCRFYKTTNEIVWDSHGWVIQTLGTPDDCPFSTSTFLPRPNSNRFLEFSIEFTRYFFVPTFPGFQASWVGSKMWCQQMESHRLAREWRHWLSHESNPFAKNQTLFLKREKWARTNQHGGPT